MEPVPSHQALRSRGYAAAHPDLRGGLHPPPTRFQMYHPAPHPCLPLGALNCGRGVLSPLLHVSCREAVLNADRALRQASLSDAHGVAQGAAAKQWDKRPAPLGPGRCSRPSGTRTAGGAGGRKPGPRACPRPRGLGHPGHRPAPDAKRPGKGCRSRQTRASSPAVSVGHRPRMTWPAGACDASGRCVTPCPAAQRQKGRGFRAGGVP